MPINPRKVKLRYQNNRYVFVYKVQSGDTVSEIAQDLLGSSVSIDVIRLLNPSLSDSFDIQSDQEIVITIATPRMVKEFLSTAWKTQLPGNVSDDPLHEAEFTLVENIIKGVYEGDMP